MIKKLYRAAYLAIFGWWVYRIYKKMFLMPGEQPQVSPAGYKWYWTGYREDNGQYMWWWQDDSREMAMSRRDSLIRRCGLDPMRVCVRGSNDGGAYFTTLIRSDPDRMPANPDDLIEAGCLPTRSN